MISGWYGVPKAGAAKLKVTQSLPSAVSTFPCIRTAAACVVPCGTESVEEVEHEFAQESVVHSQPLLAAPSMSAWPNWHCAIWQTPELHAQVWTNAAPGFCEAHAGVGFISSVWPSQSLSRLSQISV